MPIFEDLKVFTGNSHPALARDICSYLGLGLGDCEVFKFSNDESFVRIKENIREKDVFLVQSVGRPVNDNLVELLIMIDAARRASAGRITTVIPYYPYGRTDKKDQPRVAITARLVADFISVAGADRVLTTNLHAGQIQGFFNIPLDELTAIPLLAQQFSHLKEKDLVVAATDVGAAKRARYMADHLDAPIAIIDKQRLGNEDRVRAVNVIGNVEGKTALIVDDEINTGGHRCSRGGGPQGARRRGHLLHRRPPHPVGQGAAGPGREHPGRDGGDGHAAAAPGEAVRGAEGRVRCRAAG